MPEQIGSYDSCELASSDLALLGQLEASSGRGFIEPFCPGELTEGGSLRLSIDAAAASLPPPVPARPRASVYTKTRSSRPRSQSSRERRFPP